MKIQMSEMQKKATLESAKAQIVNELYRLLITNGIDPDDFDPSKPLSNADFAAAEESIDEKTGGQKAFEIGRIKELCASYVIAQGKIDSIS
jgi:hypothetical protein